MVKHIIPSLEDLPKFFSSSQYGKLEAGLDVFLHKQEKLNNLLLPGMLIGGDICSFAIVRRNFVKRSSETI